jgi:hypothetical protein
VQTQDSNAAPSPLIAAQASSTAGASQRVGAKAWLAKVATCPRRAAAQTSGNHPLGSMGVCSSAFTEWDGIEGREKGGRGDAADVQCLVFYRPVEYSLDWSGGSPMPTCFFRFHQSRSRLRLPGHSIFTHPSSCPPRREGGRRRIVCARVHVAGHPSIQHTPAS